MRAPRVTGWVLVAATAAAAPGCGGVEDRQNRPRPPAAITVTAAIAGGRVIVSPRAFGAGPVVLLISNQTARAQALTFETDALRAEGPRLVRTTRAIVPAGTATLEVDPARGRYTIRTDDRRIRPAAVRVGAPRASAQDQLLTP